MAHIGTSALAHLEACLRDGDWAQPFGASNPWLEAWTPLKARHTAPGGKARGVCLPQQMGGGTHEWRGRHPRCHALLHDALHGSFGGVGTWMEELLEASTYLLPRQVTYEGRYSVVASEVVWVIWGCKF